MIQDAARQLTTLLRQELALCQELKPLLEQEYEILCQPQIGPLNRITEEKQRLVSHMQTQGRQRDLVLKQLGLPLANPGMEAFLARHRDEQLAATWQQLQEAAAGLRQQNEVNGGIVALGARHARQALDLLKGQEPSSGTYGRRGEVSNHPGSRNLTKA